MCLTSPPKWVRELFVSYAQNFEDVLLWRALKDVPKGRYIDVGAQHPVADSVSKGFYDIGWRGVHIEPVPEYANLLRANRPEEQVFQAALGATAGIDTLFCIPDSGLSTVVEDVARHHAPASSLVVREIAVPRMTLNQIFEALPDKEAVHWLKIDVEGAEKAVLLGWNKKKYRPWIVVVEATLPGSTEERFADWEAELTDHAYAHVYSDGLNRFYLAAEQQAALGSRFAYPPNVFDDASLSGLAHSPWTYLVASRGAETARELHTALEQAHANHSSELERLHRTIGEIQQHSEAQSRAAQATSARLNADSSGRELALQQQLQRAQSDAVQWSQTLAQREKSFSDALSGHFREFQSTMASAVTRADTLTGQAASVQREVIALTSQVALLREANARERELLASAAHDASLLANVTQQSQVRATELVSEFQAREAELLTQSRAHAGSLDTASQEISRLTAAMAAADKSFQSQLAESRASHVKLNDTMVTLSAANAQQLDAAEICVQEIAERLQQTELLAQARGEAINQAKLENSFLINTSRQHEARVAALSESLSWQLTSPLRRMLSVVQQMVVLAKRGVVGLHILLLRIAKPFLLFAVGWVRRHPMQQRWLLRVLLFMPGLRGWSLEYAAEIPFPTAMQPHLSAPSPALALPTRTVSAASEQLLTEDAPTAAIKPAVLIADDRADEFDAHLRAWRLGKRVNVHA